MWVLLGQLGSASRDCEAELEAVLRVVVDRTEKVIGEDSDSDRCVPDVVLTRRTLALSALELVAPLGIDTHQRLPPFTIRADMRR